MIVPVFIPNAGCPFRCIFCNQEPVTGRKRQPLSSQWINKEIERFLEFSPGNRHPVQISFYGGNFLGLPFPEQKKALDVAQSFVDRGKTHALRFSTRPDTIDDERLNRLKNYAVTTVEIGAQSMDDRVLQICRRGHTAEQTRKAAGRLQRRGYQVGLQMMIGLPGDDAEGALKTARQLMELGPDFVRIYPTVVLKNSQLAASFSAGEYAPLNLSEAVSLTKQAYNLFKKNGIPVIRMGLHASEDLAGGDAVIAGPFHPAFGHLVLSAVVLDKVLSRLPEHSKRQDVLVIAIHPRSESRLRGEKNANIQFLKKQGPFRDIRIVRDPSLLENEPKILS